MTLGNRTEGLPPEEPVLSDSPVLFGQVFDSKSKVVRVFDPDGRLLCFLHADEPVRRFPICLLNPFVLGVHDSPDKVRLGIRQSLRIVCPGSAGDGDHAFTLKVWKQD